MTRHIRFGCGWAVIAQMLGIPLAGLLVWICFKWLAIMLAPVEYIPAQFGLTVGYQQALEFLIAFPICIFVVGFVVSLWTQRRSR